MNQFDHLKESLRDYLEHGGETVDLIDAATDVLADCDEYGPWLVGELQRITERMEWPETGQFPAHAKTTRAPLIRCPVCGSSNVTWRTSDLAVEDSLDHHASLPAGCDEPECGAEWLVWLDVSGYTLTDAGAATESTEDESTEGTSDA